MYHFCDKGTLSDYSTGNTVKIGNQVWTVENLKTTKYNDGTPIPQWSIFTSGDTLGAYCYYEKSTLNKAKYGALYTW